MSILQEYEKHAKMIGENKYKALLEYIKKRDVSYSNVMYKKKDWKEFDKWYKEVYNGGYGKSSGGNKKV